MFEKGDIVLVHGAKTLSKAILFVLRRFQKDDVYYTHVILCCGGNEGIEANIIINKCNIEDKLQKAIRYKVIRNNHLTDLQKDRMVKMCSSLLYVPYGVSRLLMQLGDQITGTNFFTKRIKSKYVQVCSSLVAWSYYSVAKIKFNGVDWKACEPDDIDDESIKNPQSWMIISSKNLLSK